MKMTLMSLVHASNMVANSGCALHGVCGILYYRQRLGKWIRKLETASNDGIWIRLDKFLFGLLTDVYLCALCIPPDNYPIYNLSKDGEDRRQELCKKVVFFASEMML